MTATIVEQPATKSLNDREKTAARLIKSSAEHSYNPEIDVDWTQAPTPGLYYCPEHECSLLGTALWESMTPEERIESSKHQVASIAAVGIWFELILMQMLIRRIYDQSPTTDHTRYGLIEIADECRHSIMFGRMITAFDCPDYGPSKLSRLGGRFIKTFADGPVTYAGALIAEEILDSFQRDAINNETVQPMVRTVSKIHVTEEARHVRYAKEELARLWADVPAWRKVWDRFLIAGAAAVITRELVHRDAYDFLGPERATEARKQAKSNPNWRKAKTHAARKLVASFEELGLINGLTRWRWRLAGLLG